MAKRRDHGEGSIFQRERDGKWVARLDYGYVDGKRKRVERTSATKAEARQKLSELKKEQEQGIQPEAGKLTVDKHLAEWLEHVKRSKAPNTYRIHEQAIRLRWKPSLGRKLLLKLQVNDVQAVLNRMEDEGKSRRLIENTRNVLSAALSWAEKQDRVTRNVARLTYIPAGQAPKPHQWLTPDDAVRLLEVIKGDKFEPLVILMLSLGLRRGEACALHWSNIDFEDGWISIEGNLQINLEGIWEIRSPKTEAGKRKVPLLPNLERLLKAHRAQQNLQKRMMGEEWKEHDLIFPNDRGGPLSERTLSKHLRILYQRKDFPHIGLHALRHSCASILLAQGEVEMKDIQNLLGHTRIAITADIYSHLLPERKRKVLSSMDALIGGAGR